jgi:glycosyltransferase involved in cell wall biosynthesis
LWRGPLESLEGKPIRRVQCPRSPGVEPSEQAEYQTLRIVYLNPVGVIGGAERCLLAIMGSLREFQPHTDLHLIAATDGPLLSQARDLGVEVHRLPMPNAIADLGDFGLQGRRRLGAALSLARRSLPAGLATRRYVQQLRRLLQELQPSLVHSNGIKTHLLARLAVPKGSPIVWHVHDFLSLRPLVARALRWASGRTAAAVAVSQAVADDARTVLGELPIEVVYNATDTTAFSPGPSDGERLDALAGWGPAPPGTLRVGLIATYARWKGQDLFLRAITQLPHVLLHQAVRFYIIGGPIYRTAKSQFSEDELRRLAAELKIVHQVGFIGFQANVAEVYRALDVVIHASTQPEPFGLTIVEAMACAKPVIVTQTGGAAELFQNDHDAVGVPPGDEAALATAIYELVTNPARRQRLGAQARQTAVTRFSRPRLGPEMAAVYQRLV